MDMVWDVLRWGALVVGIVFSIVFLLISIIFLWLLSSEDAKSWQRSIFFSFSLFFLYLPIYCIGVLILLFSDYSLSGYHAMLYVQNIAWWTVAVGIAILILSIAIGCLQEVFRRRQQRAAEVSALMQIAGKPSEEGSSRCPR
jgi:ABC-type tungstate transport system substrate-binding protein